MAEVRIREFNGVLKRFFDQCSDAMDAVTRYCLNELAKKGHELGHPISKKIGSGIWELRPKASPERATLFYFFHNGDPIFLFSFYKKMGERDKTHQFKAEAIRIKKRIETGEAVDLWTMSRTLN